jgi:hypothetical protein
MAREWALRNSSLGGQRGERAAPVKEASQKGVPWDARLKVGLWLAPAKPVLRILDRIEPGSPIMPAAR